MNLGVNGRGERAVCPNANTRQNRNSRAILDRKAPGEESFKPGSQSGDQKKKEAGTRWS